MSTAKSSDPISGDKLYQERARAALPLLVRQAQAGVPIYYSDLAEELGMPNPRNLNYVLGSIGQTLKGLSKEWNEKVPPIQCLVVNRATGLPGEGIGWFLVKKEDFSALPLRQKRAIVEAELQHVFSYPRWGDVLKALSLTSTESDYTQAVKKALSRGRGGESEEHKALKSMWLVIQSLLALEPLHPMALLNMLCLLATAWMSRSMTRVFGWRPK